MFKVNNKATRTTKLMLLWCLNCLLWIDFTPCFSALVIDFEHVNVDFVQF